LFSRGKLLKGQLKLRETKGGLNGTMGSFVVATYAYLYARTSCKAFVPENGKVERNNMELRIFPKKLF